MPPRCAPIGRYGNCGVGILEGPGTATFSMSAGTTFQIAERIGVRYEAQFANLVQHPEQGRAQHERGSEQLRADYREPAGGIGTTCRPARCLRRRSSCAWRVLFRAICSSNWRRS
jgi:hypothetical protein